jgi:hypothetical protein
MSAHPIDCFCPHCVQDVRGQADAAQAQTLRILDDLARIRRRLHSLQKAVVARCAAMNRLIDAHIGPTKTGAKPQTDASSALTERDTNRKVRTRPARGRKEHRR